MNMQFEKLVNKGLGRPLTQDELAAVKWWVSVNNFEKNHYDKELENMIVVGNIKEIQYKFVKHGSDTEWIKNYRYFEQWAHEEELAELEAQFSNEKNWWHREDLGVSDLLEH